MNQSLGQLLAATQSIHAPERTAAEAALSAQGPSLGPALASLLADESAPAPARQLAGVVLRGWASRWWEEAGEAARSAVRREAPRALGAAQSKVRTAAAGILAAVGKTDFPARWPSLLSDLVACLGSANGNLARGALKTLDFLATAQMSDDQVPPFVQTVFPALHAVFVSASFDEAAKSRAASIVSAIVLWIGAMASENPDAYAKVITQSMQMWMDGFCSVLAGRDSPTSSSCQLKIKIVTILSSYAHYFPKLFRPYAPKCAELVWANLLRDIEIYDKVAVQADLLEGDANDSDGNVIGFDLLIASYFDFVSTLVSKKSFKEIVTKNYPSLLRAIFFYAQLSHVQCEQFLSDPNEFVAAEDDDLGAFSIRQECIAVVHRLSDVYRKEFLQALLREAKQVPQQTSWKMRESFLFIVGSVMSDLKKHPDLFDLNQFVGSLIPDMTAENPFLRGRALWCASHSRTLDAQLSASVCKVALQLLTNKKEHLPVRFAAVKAVALLAHQVPPDVIYPAMRPAIESCCAIFQFSTPDTIPSALETLEMLLQANPRACAEGATFVSEQLVRVWKMHINDGLVTALVVDLVAALAVSPESVGQINNVLMPAIITLLGNPQTEAHVIATAIEVLTLLVRGTPRCLQGPAIFGQLLVRVVGLALSTDEIGLMQATTKALTAFVISNGPALAQFRVNNDTGVAAMLSVLRRLLDPKTPEDGADNVGKLVLKMIQLLDLTAATPQILGMMLPRLGQTQSPRVVQTLVLVFARLIHQNPAPVVEFLSNTKVPDGSTGLTFLLRIWVDNQTAFYGSYQVRVTLFALLILFKLNAPMVNAIKVKGPEVAPTGRATRSKGPIRYSEIPIQQKIFEICLQTFVERMVDQDDGPDNDDENFEEYSSEEELGFGGEFGEMTSRPLDALLRMANAEDVDEEDEDDPEFKDDPINKIDVLLHLREFLFGLMKASPKVFEQSVGQCSDSEVRQMFYQMWPVAVQAHLSSPKKQ